MKNKWFSILLMILAVGLIAAKNPVSEFVCHVLLSGYMVIPSLLVCGMMVAFFAQPYQQVPYLTWFIPCAGVLLCASLLAGIFGVQDLFLDAVIFFAKFCFWACAGICIIAALYDLRQKSLPG